MKYVKILLALFGLFLLYQIIRIILGGSWQIEEVILALLVFNISLTVTLLIPVIKNSMEVKHLKEQFKALVHDFKINNTKLNKLESELKRAC